MPHHVNMILMLMYSVSWNIYFRICSCVFSVVLMLRDWNQLFMFTSKWEMVLHHFGIMEQILQWFLHPDYSVDCQR
jgi:hypothetical protein